MLITIAERITKEGTSYAKHITCDLPAVPTKGDIILVGGPSPKRYSVIQVLHLTHYVANSESRIIVEVEPYKAQKPRIINFEYPTEEWPLICDLPKA